MCKKKIILKKFEKKILSFFNFFNKKSRFSMAKNQINKRNVPLSQRKGPVKTNVASNFKTREELLAEAAYKRDKIKSLNIISSNISLYSYEGMYNASDKLIINKPGVFFDPSKTEYTVNDPRMGGINSNAKSSKNFLPCKKCNQIDCPGHYGLIPLKKGSWIINPIFIKEVARVLQCVCHCCSRLLACKSSLEKEGLLSPDLSGDIKLKKIYEISKKILCCKNKNEVTEYQSLDGEKLVIKKLCDIAPLYNTKKIQIEGVIKFIKRREDGKPLEKVKGSKSNEYAYTVERVYSILDLIPDEDAEILGFNVKLGCHPRNAVLKAILVIPESARTPAYEGTNELKPDNLTNKYSYIVNKVTSINKSPLFDNLPRIREYEYSAEKVAKSSKKEDKNAFLTDKEKLAEINAKVHNLYIAYYNLLSNNPENKTKKKVGTKEYKSVLDRLQGKEAIMRFLLMGKRNDYCARTVASPNTALKFGTASLPSVWKRILTKKVKVNDLNISYLNMLKQKGEIEHIISGTTKIRFSVVPKQNYQLKIGDIVERHGQDGDRHILNRQPSLHKYSIMSYEVIYTDTLTIGHHLSHTTPMNMDFDGDECNVWDPQNLEVESECLEIMNVRNNVISGQSSKPCMGLVMNSVTGAFLLTDKTERLPKKFFKEVVGIIENDEFLDTLAERLEKFGVHPYSGQAVFSCLLPSDFNYDSAGKEKISIREGVLIRGRLRKVHVGTSDRSIVQELWKKYGHKRVTKFLTDAPRVINYWLKEVGFTVGLADCFNSATNPITNASYSKGSKVSKENISITGDELSKMYLEIDALDLNKKESKAIAELKERKVCNILNITESAGAKIAKEILQGNNSIGIMTEEGSGAKGATANIMQILGAVGQQYEKGKRFAQNITDGTRCLPAYDKNDTKPEARGFVQNSFIEGLDPEGLFKIHCGCRENLTDTSLKTAVTGTIEHLLIRSLENIVVMHDLTVRSINTFMLYNTLFNNTYDPCKMVKIKDLQNNDRPSFVDINSLCEDILSENGFYPEELANYILKQKEELSLELLNKPIQPLKLRSKKVLKPHPNLFNSNRAYGELPQKLSLYENTRIIWTRAMQLANNAPPLIDIRKEFSANKILQGKVDAHKIARKEFKKGLLKIYAIRVLPSGEIHRVYPTIDNINYTLL